MPGKKDSGSPNEKVLQRLTVASIKQVWKAIDRDSWFNYLTTIAPAYEWKRKGPRIMGLCPFHEETSPSFTVDFEKHHAKCFGCGRYFWNPFQFVAAVRTKAGKATSYVDALVDMKQRFDLADLRKNVIEGLSNQWKRRTMKRLLWTVSNKELNATAELIKRSGFVAACEDQRYGYAARTVRYLEYRGITATTTNWYGDLPIGVLASEMRLEELLRKQADDEGFDAGQMWDLAKDYLEPLFGNVSLWQGAMLFFTGETPDLPSNVKVRAVPMLLPNGTFATDDKKHVQWLKDESEDRRGQFGLACCAPYGRLIDAQATKSFVVVEGEFDALSIMVQQFADLTCSKMGCIVFAGGGGAIDGLDYLKEFGFEMAYVVGDNDPGGSEFAKSALERTVRMSMRLFVWPAALAIPGQEKIDPDDAVKAFGLDPVQAAIRDAKNYLLPYTWASQRALEEMVGVDEQDLKALTGIAGKWGVYVRDEAEQQAYVEIIKRAHHAVNTGVILSKMVSSDEHEEAFMERIRVVLASRLSVLDCVHEGNSTILRVYDRITDTLYDLPLNESKRLAAQISALSRGKDVYQFVRNEVGEPGFLSTYAELLASGKRFYAEMDKYMEYYVQKAVQRLTGLLPSGGEMKVVSAGTHVVERTREDGSTYIDLYAVKGMSLFKGTYEGDSDTPIWRQCPGPADENVVVYAEHSRRPLDAYPLYHTEDDFNRAPRLTFVQLYETVYKILNVGWRFKHHENTCHFLAAIILQSFIADAFPRQPLLMLTAEHSSGKTNLIGGLIGRSAKASINIVQPALWMDNYTVAGVRQSMNFSTMILCLDEFEDKGLAHDRKSQTVNSLTQHFRGLANEMGMTVQGSVSGKAVEYRVHHPVYLAGIRQTQEIVDLSRIIMIEMDRREGLPTPEVSLMEHVGAKTLRTVLEDAPLIMWRELKALRRLHEEIAEEFKYGAGVEFSDVARSREHFYGALAVLKHAGQDYKTLFQEHYRLNRTYLARIAQSSVSGDIFTTVLNVPAIHVLDGGTTVLKPAMSILASSDPANLNHSNSGLYYDEELKALVIDFALARWTILQNVPEYNRPAHWLKAHAQRSPYFINDEHFRHSGAFDRLLQFMTRGVSMINVAAFKVTDYLSDAASTREPGKLRGIDDTDVSQSYAKDLEKASFPKPTGPKYTGKDKEAAAAGTSKDGSAPDGTTGPKKGVKDDDFEY
jgi:translation initiation factor 2 beta subunit (eIF-2beta)/eIF-5